MLLCCRMTFTCAKKSQFYCTAGQQLSSKQDASIQRNKQVDELVEPYKIALK